MKLYSFLVLLVAMFLFGTSCEQSQRSTRNKNSRPDKVVTVPAFDADSAYSFVEKQVSFGPRVPGTTQHAECANWLNFKLSKFADTVYMQQFKARTYDKVTRNGINIIGVFNPDAQKRILLMAHWDSRPFADYDENEKNHNTPIDGANDGASGVGILLEAARQMHLKNPEVGVDIVFFDLEDWGPPRQLNMTGEEYWGLGSQYWSNNPHIYGYDANFGILLDMVGASDPIFRQEYFSKKYARYVVDLVWETASDIGFGEFFIKEDGIAATDDHVPVNEIAEIPSIDIIHQAPPNSGKSFFEHWHTVNDNLDAIDKSTLRMVGQVVLTVVYNE